MNNSIIFFEKWHFEEPYCFMKREIASRHVMPKAIYNLRRSVLCNINWIIVRGRCNGTWKIIHYIGLFTVNITSNRPQLYSIRFCNHLKIWHFSSETIIFMTKYCNWTLMHFAANAGGLWSWSNNYNYALKMSGYSILLIFLMIVI